MATRAEHCLPEAVRNRNLMRNYGITSVQYDQMREDQGYRCAACGRSEEEIKDAYAGKPAGRPRKDGAVTEPMWLQVDHCHRSLVIRKLLCGNCNRIIAQAGEDIAVLEGCIDYLRSRSTPTRSTA